MWDKFISFINALIVNALLLAIVFYSVVLPKEPSKTLLIAPENIMQAVAVDEKQMLVAMRQIKSQSVRERRTLRAQQRELDRKKRQLERTVLKETQRLDKLRKQKEKEQQRLAKTKQRKWAEADTLRALKRKKAEQAYLRREAEEIRRLEEAHRKALEAAARERKQREQAAKRRAEQARLAREAEKKRRAKQARLAREAEKRRLADAKRRQAERRARLAAEKKRKAAQVAKQRAEQKKRIQKVMRDIQQQVLNFWVRPRGYYRGLSCIIEIRLGPGGEVTSVQIIERSGNFVFDNSALKAIRNASPLPVPADIFDTFKHFNFRFKPK